MLARNAPMMWSSGLTPHLPVLQKGSPAASGPSVPSTAGTSLVTTPSLMSEDTMSEETVLGPRLTNAQRKNLRCG